MGFELTINRVGAFAGTTSGTRLNDPDAVEELFRNTLVDVVKHPKYKSALDGIQGCAEDFREIKSDYGASPESQQVRIRRTVPKEGAAEDDWTFVGTLPSQKFACTVSPISGKSRQWITDARASITGCALKNGKRNTKLWWTFEGVPLDEDPSNRPSEHDIAAFVAQTDSMADSAIDPLYDAFAGTLRKVRSLDLRDFHLRKNRIRVRMSDANTYEVEALLDALYYQHHDVSEIRDAPELSHARKGLLLFEKFVGDVTNQKVFLPDRSLKVDGRFDGFKGIFYRTIVDDKDTVVVGFGHQSGSVSGLESAVAPDKRKLEKQESNLRAMSPSRPISAVLADDEAAALDPAS